MSASSWFYYKKMTGFESVFMYLTRRRKRCRWCSALCRLHLDPCQRFEVYIPVSSQGSVIFGMNKQLNRKL